MKKIIFLLVMISNIFTYELYKEIRINNVDNKLVFTYTDEDYIDIETYDYSITGTTLTLNMPEVNDCSTELSIYTFTKQ